MEKDDVFITSYWGVKEVCIVTLKGNDFIQFRRLEAINEKKPLIAQMSDSEFTRMIKQPLHKSTWYNTSIKQPIYGRIALTSECEHPYWAVYRKMDYEKCTKCGKVLAEW